MFSPKSDRYSVFRAYYVQKRIQSSALDVEDKIINKILFLLRQKTRLQMFYK